MKIPDFKLNIGKGFSKLSADKQKYWIEKYLVEKELKRDDFDKILFINWMIDKVWTYLEKY